MRNTILFLIIFLITPLLLAQRISGELRLQVTDATGGGVRSSGTIVGQATGVDRTFETNEAGQFTLRGLPPGRYELTVGNDNFAPRKERIQIDSELPLEHLVTLELKAAVVTLDVQELDTLLDPIRTADYLPRTTLQNQASAVPNRAIINLVNTQPGWLLEANGTLHPRGSEYDVQYVVDGVPFFDNRSPAFGQSSNIDEFQSLNVRTGGYPAEFGLKLGGVIETATDEDAHPGIHGMASLQGGSFGSGAAFLSMRYGRKATSLTLNGNGMMTDRYLDAPVPQNYTNRGTASGVSAILDREWSSLDRTRIYVSHSKSAFMVPNEVLQQLAGQRQDRNGEETIGQASHTRIFSPHLLGQFRAMARDTNARLWSNIQSTPIRPAQDRGFREAYLAGSVSAHFGAHELKGGVETWFSSTREDLGFHIATYRIGAVRIFDRDIPQDFHFQDTAPGRTQSAFLQDAWHAGPFTLNAGLRLDHYTLVARDHAWSPRVGAAYTLPRAGLVLRASYDRVFQIPAIENILLASSDVSATLGGGAFLPLNPSHANFFEAGFSKSVSSRVRIDGNWYRRRFDNFADDSLLFNTGVSFPITFSRATIHGLESKIEVRSLGPFSAYFSYSNMIGTGRLPVAGGLFLGDDARTLLDGSGTFPISQDQRNTFRSQVRFQPAPRFWTAVAGAYNSGLPFEIDGPSNKGFLALQYGPEILRRVNFERGRVRPSASLDVSGGVGIVHSEKMKLDFQADLFNLTNRLNLINFAGVFSGTALDAPRSFTLRLRSEF